MNQNYFIYFPSDFIFGAATSAYQIEGAWNEEGRTPSIWDNFCRLPGKIEKGESGDLSCAHYHLYEEDVKLMAELGLQAYRFSISWPRIYPQAGKLNQKGLDFYQRLSDLLLENKITPWITLYHYDLPNWIQEKGGWANSEVLHYFGQYAETVVKTLGDRVKHWFIINEPRPIAWIGHLQGRHAPGLSDYQTFLKVVGNLRKVQFNTAWQLPSLWPDLIVGTVIDLTAFEAVSDRELDLQAAKQADEFFNRLYLDPLLLGEYPPLAEKIGLESEAAELNKKPAKLDFIGINYYFRNVVAYNPNSSLIQANILEERSFTTEMGWKIYPLGLKNWLIRLKTDYKDPLIYITENGAAFQDLVTRNGIIQDNDRISFLQDHLTAVALALKAGVKIGGFFTWSLLDNFEWACGYAKKFGLVRVDFNTQKRYPKKSFFWYKEVIAKKALDLLANFI